MNVETKINSQNSFQYKKSLSNSLLSVNGAFFAFFINFLIGIIIAKKTDPQIFGNYNLALAIATTTVLFVKAGTGKGLIKYIPVFAVENHYGKIKGLIRNVVICILVLWTVFAISIGSFQQQLSTIIFKNKDLNYMIGLVIIHILILVIYSTYSNIILSFKLINSNTIITKYFTPIIFIISCYLSIVFFNKDDSGIYFARIISQFLSFILIYLVYFKNVRSKLVKYKYEAVDNKAIFIYCIPLFFTETISQVMEKVDVIMIGAFIGTYEVGIYSVVVKLMSVALLASFAVSQALAPVISELSAKNDISSMGILYKNISKWLFLFGSNFCIFVICFRNQLLNIFGKEYVAGGSMVLVILSIAYFFKTTGALTSNILVVRDKQKQEFINNCILLTINIVLNAVLINILGIIGAAIATSISTIGINIARIVQVRKSIDTIPFSKESIYIVLSVLLSGIVSEIFKIIVYGNEFAKLAYGFLIFAIINIFFLIKFILNEEEKGIVKRFKLKLHELL